MLGRWWCSHARLLFDWAVSSKYCTYKTVKARFWPWPSGQSPHLRSVKVLITFQVKVLIICQVTAKVFTTLEVRVKVFMTFQVNVFITFLGWGGRPWGSRMQGRRSCSHSRREFDSVVITVHDCTVSPLGDVHLSNEMHYSILHFIQSYFHIGARIKIEYSL